jgi:vanillate/3-O-methylgallate O-demethylase
MKPYREWLPGGGYEASGSIGGSFVSEHIEDYYLTPHELGYGSYVMFDHDFIGRGALEAKKDAPHRQKVTFEWNPDDVGRIFQSMFNPPGENYKVIDSFKERARISVGIVDSNIDVGAELTLVWGEEGGGPDKTTVEPHQQTEIRVRVAPTPISQGAREAYARGWRTQDD